MIKYKLLWHLKAIKWTQEELQFKSAVTNIFFVCVCLCLGCFSSYLFPDGRAQNPDLTGLCEPSPQDHIKVTQVWSCLFLICEPVNLIFVPQGNHHTAKDAHKLDSDAY